MKLAIGGFGGCAALALPKQLLHLNNEVLEVPPTI